MLCLRLPIVLPRLLRDTSPFIPSTLSLLFDRLFFFFSFFSPDESLWNSSGIGGGGGDEGIIICRGLFLWERPEAELRKLLKVDP